MKNLIIGGLSLVAMVLGAFMLHPEGGATTVPCRTCKGTGNCQTCGGDSEKKKNCVRCFYSGRCQKCGGTKVEVVSRFEADRLGYR